MMKINKIIMSLMLVLTLTFGCITTTSAADVNPYYKDIGYTDMKLWQEGDKAYVSAQYLEVDGNLPKSYTMAVLCADYSDGSWIRSKYDPVNFGSYPEDLYLAKNGCNEGYTPIFMTNSSGYLLIDGFDADIIRQDNIEKIYLARNTGEPFWIVYDREVDGSIYEYLDNNKGR